MLDNATAYAFSLLTMISASVKSASWADLFVKLKQMFPMPVAWETLSLITVSLVFLIGVGSKLAGIFGWIGIQSPFNQNQLSEAKLEDLRSKLLTIVRKDIDSRLSASLHQLIKIDLCMKDRPESIGKSVLELAPEDFEGSTEDDFSLPINRVFYQKVKGKRQSKELSLSKGVIEVFEDPDTQGKLLILGEPGSGKTTELLTLAKNLAIRAEEKENAPVPVILELSGWKDEPIGHWVEGQCQKRFGISENTTSRWLETHKILLLLDGLDELGLKAQKKCIRAINQFVEVAHTPEIVVCCRQKEYEANKRKLNRLRGAVSLQKLSKEQIEQYFSNLNRSTVWDNLCQNAALVELAQKPLFLFMLVLAYRGEAIRNEQELFELYIEKQLAEVASQEIYKSDKVLTQERMIRYLTWLSKQLECIQETEFLIEQIQPSWLASEKQRSLYLLLCRLIIGLPFGILVGLLSGILGGLPFGLVFGILFGLSISSTVKDTDIEPIEKLQISTEGVLSIALGIGLITWLFAALTGAPGAGLGVGLILGPGGGLVLGLTTGVKNNPIKEKKIPNQGIRKSIQNAVLFGLVGSLVGAATFGWLNSQISGLTSGIICELAIVLTFMMRGGLKEAIRHFILRIFLTKSGVAPWNYALFLEHAVKHRFIQRTGGRYRFVHDLLRKHFAQLPSVASGDS